MLTYLYKFNKFLLHQNIFIDLLLNRKGFKIVGVLDQFKNEFYRDVLFNVECFEKIHFTETINKLVFL